MSDRSYGMCPTQVDGITADRKPFYFRSRSGQWTLAVGEPGWKANICAWPGDYVDRIAFRGPGDINDPDVVDALIDERLGPGWRHATWEEIQFDGTCNVCGKTFHTDGSNICSKCLADKIFGARDA